MFITALPESTINLLGSGQALTTPLSLVKELIDNSLDAKATSIDILISQNTLDKIEVRDNGHGISSDDLDALGKRGYTSKLRSFEELTCLGGVSLGFRGEALASAVQLGDLSVTTKTEGEALAATAKLKPTGGIVHQSHASHPVGTTISVKNFISKIPVRKQTALKAAPKTHLKLKELLQSYALARPTIRLSLKIMKERKGSWSFAPRPNDGIKEVVSQVIGRDTAAQCFERSISFPGSASRMTFSKEPELRRSGFENLESSVGSIDGSYIVELFALRTDADPSKFARGQYLSIDSRPVSCEKGTMRKIVALYKFYVKAYFCSVEKISNPFMRLNLKCPVASYDPNVEPAKDDVLFGNEEHVLECIENIFKNIYQSSAGNETTDIETSLNEQSRNFGLFRDRRDPEMPLDIAKSVDERDAGASEQSKISNFPHEPKVSASWTFAADEGAISICNEDDISAQQASERRSGIFEGLSSRNGVYDKLKTLNKFLTPNLVHNSKLQAICSDYEHETRSCTKLDSPFSIRGDRRSTMLSYSEAPNPPPAPGGSPKFRRSSDPVLLNTEDPNFLIPLTRQRRNSNPTFQKSTSLADQSCPDIHDELSCNSNLVRRDIYYRTAEHKTDLVAEDDAVHIARKNDFIEAKRMLELNRTLISPHTTQRPAEKRLRKTNSQFISPIFRRDGPVARAPMRQTTLLSNSLQSQIRAQQTDYEDEAEPSLERWDPTWAMDFEHRKEEATRQRRQQSRAAEKKAEQQLFTDNEMARSSPHQNRYNSAIASLESIAQAPVGNSLNIESSLKTSLLDGDSRAYLMQQRSTLAHPSKANSSRTKSSRLPLEKVPTKEQLHNILLSQPHITVDNIFELSSALLESDIVDDYVSRGIISSGIRTNASDKNLLIERIQTAVGKRANTLGGQNFEFEYNFENL